MTIEKILVPDIGGDAVELVELCVAVGDTVELDQTLVVLESDKASMEIPSTFAGVITQLSCTEGDKVAEGDVLGQLEVQGQAEATPKPAADVTPTSAAEKPAPQADSQQTVETVATSIEILVPDIGGEAEVVEISVAVGELLSVDDVLCVLESDKASMEVPCAHDATVLKWLINEGDKVSEGTPMVVLNIAAAPDAAEPASVKSVSAEPQPANTTAPEPAVAAISEVPATDASDSIYAGPLVRKLARELGVDLTKVVASGPRSRISKDDVKAYVKAAVNRPEATANNGSGIPVVPAVDFSDFGAVRTEKMTKIHKLTAANMHRSWLNVPHVTQFDDIDITELEVFRKSMKAEAAATGVKLTPLPFLIKACAAALRKHPTFNASLHSDGEHIVYKDYINIGIAVDTPMGLMVPVIKNADKMGLYELAEESTRLAVAAKERKLKPAEMKGGCFTISSLGGIGGKGFTPIVNTPEVAILGVSRLSTQPVWDGAAFVPRKMLPLCLSYDHRAINGSDAGRFLTDLGQYLAEVRRLLL